MDRAAFVTLVVPGDGADRPLLLARSIREFGGSMAGAPILGMVPTHGPRMSRAAAAEYEELAVRLVPFEVDPALRPVPFGIKARAAAHAEELAASPGLIWLDPDTLVIGDAAEFLIPDDAVLGYRPVHHRLIGPPWDGQLDPYWSAVREICEVPEGSDFRMTTRTGEAIRPYFNAGVFVVRPDRGLLRQWPGVLTLLAREPRIADQYRSNRLYQVFLHQAAWTALVLRTLDRSEMVELDPSVDYPFHLHEEIPARRRAVSLDSLVGIRTEDVFDDPEWPDRLPVLAPMAPWVQEHFGKAAG